jgi:fermentation-respiration switch protein FrsA (DUF1100 family)
MSALIVILAALALLYLAICLLMVIFQGRFVFFPTRELMATPEQYGLAYRDVELRTKDGVRLHAWFVPRERARAALLFCHGNAGNIADRLDSLQLFHEMGLAVLIFDYRGYGRSAGRPGETGLYRDARAAWDHLVEQEEFPAERIVVFGRSLGGAVAVQLASLVRPAGLIVESSFTSAAELGARLYPWLPVRQLARIRFDAAARLHDVHCPQLFVHSLDDEVVPYGLGLRLYRQAHLPKQFLRIRGGHGDGFLVSGQHYRSGLAAFLASLGLAAEKAAPPASGPVG